MIYLGNAFSLQMLEDPMASIEVTAITRWVAEQAIKSGATSIIGHQNIADALNCEMNRQSIKLKESDTLIVAQYVGGRLPEGASPTNLDNLEFMKITVKYKKLPCGELSNFRKGCDGFGCTYGHDERQCTYNFD